MNNLDMVTLLHFLPPALSYNSQVVFSTAEQPLHEGHPK